MVDCAWQFAEVRRTVDIPDVWRKRLNPGGALSNETQHFLGTVLAPMMQGAQWTVKEM